MTTPTGHAAATKRALNGGGVALMLLTTIASVGLFLPGAIWTGPFGLAWPFVYAASVYAFVGRSRSGSMSTASGELFAVLLGSVGGFGVWAALTVVGVLTSVVPFIAPSENGNPHADDWAVGSVVFGVAAAAAIWWLLRRRADQEAVGR